MDLKSSLYFPQFPLQLLYPLFLVSWNLDTQSLYYSVLSLTVISTYYAWHAYTLDGQKLSSVPNTCSSEVGAAVGALLLVEGIVAIVTAIIVVSCWLIIRYVHSKVHDFWCLVPSAQYHKYMYKHFQQEEKVRQERLCCVSKHGLSWSSELVLFRRCK